MQQAGIHPLKLLLHELSTPEKLSAIIEEARQLDPQYPQGSNTFVLMRVLELGGLSFPYNYDAQAVAGFLISRGALIIPASETPKAGDLYVACLDNHRIIELGLIAKLHLSREEVLRDWFLAVNQLCDNGRPIRRYYKDDIENAPIRFYLRLFYG